MLNSGFKPFTMKLWMYLLVHIEHDGDEADIAYKFIEVYYSRR